MESSEPGPARDRLGDREKEASRDRLGDRAKHASPGVVAAVALIAALAGTLLWVEALAGPVRLGAGLVEVRARLAAAENALGNGALKRARYETYAGRAAARRAEAGGASPALDLAAMIPRVGPFAGESGHLVGAATHATAAAAGILGVVEGSQKGPTKVIAEDPERPGHLKVHLDRVRTIGALVARARTDLDAAARALGAVDRSALPRRARPGVAEGLRRARAADRVLADAAAGFAILPGFLGEDEPRTYLLAMQNSAEQRGTGGAILQYSFLRLDEGRQQLLRAQTVYDVDVERDTLDIPLPPDAWYVAGIEDAQRFGNSNWSPDWPLSAQLILDYARATDRARTTVDFPDDVDGVIAVDPVAVESLMPGVGRFRVEAGHRLTTESIVPFVLYKAYASYPVPQQRRFVLHQIVDGFYEGMLDPSAPSALVDGMGRALSRKHVQLWLGDRREQAFVERMGWDGAIERRAPGDYLFVVEQNVGGNKLDYFDANEIEMDVAIRGRAARVSARARVSNDVFLPQPRWALGDAGATHKPMLNLYVPRRSRLVDWAIAGAPHLAPEPALPRGDLPAEHVERGKKVWSASLEIPPQARGSVRLDYIVPRAVRARGDRRVYNLVVQHQPKVRPEQLEITLRLPPGARAVVAPGWTRDGTVLQWERPLRSDVVLEVAWRAGKQ